MNAPVFNAENSASRAQAPSVATVCNDLAFDAIGEACNLAASYARSASEAAWRGDHQLVGMHLAQLRLCVLTALDARNRLRAEGDA